MVFQFYLHGIPDTIVEYHAFWPYPPPGGPPYSLPFYWLKMEGEEGSVGWVVWRYMSYTGWNTEETYPTNFLGYQISGSYPNIVSKKSFWITQDTDLWDQLQDGGYDSIPFSSWHFGLYFGCGGTYGITFTLLIEVCKRSITDVDTLLYSFVTPPISRYGAAQVYEELTKNMPEFAIVSTDRLVVKVYIDSMEGEGSLYMRMGGTTPSFVQIEELSPSPSPSPSPLLTWDDTGNLLAPVDASLKLNTNYSMLYSGTHEPKYTLDNDLSTYWRPSSTSNHSLYLKFDAPKTVDAFAFWIHNYNEGFGGSKRWSLMCSLDGFDYHGFESILFTDSRRAGTPLVVFKFDVPRIAQYWIFNLEGFGDPIEGPEDTPVGPIMEISGVWLLRDYSLPYDNQYPEPVRFEWGNDLAESRSGSSYQERRFRGHVRISDKEYVFVQQAHSDLLLNAYRASKGGLLPIAFKPDYDSIDWILCRFTSEHSVRETWSEVFQPKIEVREVGFKRIPYITKTLPMLSTTVGHWKFDESLADSSGGGHTLSVVDILAGATYDYGVCNHNKTCFVFDEDGLLEVAAVNADALDMDISNFSLETIFATSPVSETTYLLRKTGDNPSPAPSPEPSPSPVVAGYSVSITTAGKIDVCLGDGSVEVEGSGYGLDLDDGSFHYLVVTVDRTLDLLKVYIDGVQVGSSLDISAITGAITNAIEPFQIGGENLSNDPKSIIGLVDEVCVSKQLLTAALITSRHAGYSHDGLWRL